MHITVGHGIIQCLIGFLIGIARSIIPRGILLEVLYDGMVMVESGRFWEFLSLGGVAEFHKDTQDRLGCRQAGVPYLLDDGRSILRARKVLKTCILNFLSDYKFCLYPYLHYLL